MELSVLERIVLFDAMNGYAPKVGNVLTMKSVKRLLDLIPFDEGEVKDNGISFDDDTRSYKWQEKGYKRLFAFTDGELAILRQVAKALDDDGKVQLGFIDCFERIMATDAVVEAEPEVLDGPMH